ncbi:AAA family ATPase [Phycisphaeraceae bacterium D3-23]
MTATNDTATMGPALARDVLEPMKRRFVGKDEVIDLLGVCLVGGENLFILGPPGTAKSALVQDLSRRFDGRVFDYLLTRFTEPNELFGPFDIRKLREGELVTNTEGMLAEAEFVFLDELLNANSAILNSLLMALNERVFRRGRETRKLPALMFIGASNRLPEDETLGALFDRFLLRVLCENVESERLRDVLNAGWQIERDSATGVAGEGATVESIRTLQAVVPNVDLSSVREPYLELVARLRRAGIAVSDRRAVKLQRVVAASALLCGREVAQPSDLWVMRYIWDVMEQRELIREMVDQVIGQAGDEAGARHGRSVENTRPDAEALARDLAVIGDALDDADLNDAGRAHLQDRVGVLAGRVQWVDNGAQREALEATLAGLWQRLGVKQ